jgi:hypothetical protein
VRSIITAGCLQVAILKDNGEHRWVHIGLCTEAREKWAKLSLDL